MILFLVGRGKRPRFFDRHLLCHVVERLYADMKRVECSGAQGHLMHMCVESVVARHLQIMPDCKPLRSTTPIGSTLKVYNSSEVYVVKTQDGVA